MVRLSGLAASSVILAISIDAVALVEGDVVATNVPTSFNMAKLLRIDPDTGESTELVTGFIASPSSVEVDHHGNIWVQSTTTQVRELDGSGGFIRAF